MLCLFPKNPKKLTYLVVAILAKNMAVITTHSPISKVIKQIFKKQLNDRINYLSF